VKEAVFTRCTLRRVTVFTRNRRKPIHLYRFRRSISKSSGAETTRTGGSDPTFSAFIRPKVFLGSPSSMREIEERWCGRWESNPHEEKSPEDFHAVYDFRRPDGAL